MITIFTVCDNNYFNHFDILAKSYKINETNKDKVKYTHFFIYKDEKDLNSIKEKIINQYNKYINFEFVKYDNNNIKFKFFCGHYRFRAFKMLFEKNSSEILIYSDVDAYINKSLLDKVNILEESVYFFIRNNKYKDLITNKTNFDLNKEKIQKIGKTYFLL